MKTWQKQGNVEAKQILFLSSQILYEAELWVVFHENWHWITTAECRTRIRVLPQGQACKSLGFGQKIQNNDDMMYESGILAFRSNSPSLKQGSVFVLRVRNYLLRKWNIKLSPEARFSCFLTIEKSLATSFYWLMSFPNPFYILEFLGGLLSQY